MVLSRRVSARSLASRWGRALALSWIFLPFCACVAGASGPDELTEALRTFREGKDVVRVFAIYDEEPVIGRFIDAAGDSVRVKPTALPVVSIHRADVRQLDTSAKRSRATWLGLALGAVAGGLVSAAVLEDSTEMEGMMVVIILPMSVAIGGMVGSGVVDYHWQTRWQRKGG